MAMALTFQVEDALMLRAFMSTKCWRCFVLHWILWSRSLLYGANHKLWSKSCCFCTFSAWLVIRGRRGRRWPGIETSRRGKAAEPKRFELRSFLEKMVVVVMRRSLPLRRIDAWSTSVPLLLSVALTPSDLAYVPAFSLSLSPPLEMY